MIKKNQTKNLALLFILVLISFAISCGSSNVSKPENAAPEDAQADDYASLKEPNIAPQRIVEDLSGKVIVLSEEDFKSRITALDNPKGFQYLGQTPCIVDLYADWCKPCTFLSQVLNSLAPEYQGKVIFYKLNIDRAPEVVSAFKVSNIPKILYFKPHGEVSSTTGFLTKDELKKMLDDILLKP